MNKAISFDDIEDRDRTIAELRAELAALRAENTRQIAERVDDVMRLSAEIDSLRAENERLTRAVESGSDRAAAEGVRMTAHEKAAMTLSRAKREALFRVQGMPDESSVIIRRISPRRFVVEIGPGCRGDGTVIMVHPSWARQGRYNHWLHLGRKTNAIT